MDELPILDEEYEDVEVNDFFDSINEAAAVAAATASFPEYENLPHGQARKLEKHQRHQQLQQQQQQLQQQNQSVDDTMLFSVGLRFPSIRVKNENKKTSKKERLGNKSFSVDTLNRSEPVYSLPAKDKKRHSVDDLRTFPQTGVALYGGVKADATKTLPSSATATSASRTTLSHLATSGQQKKSSFSMSLCPSNSSIFYPREYISVIIMTTSGNMELGVI